MTADTQAALRRIIEAYANNTRFCIICNYLSKIIEPLASRCVKFRFSPISRESQISRLNYICEQEGIKVEGTKVLERLIEVAEGDLRRSINTLQTASAFHDMNLTEEDIYAISGIVPKDYVSQVEKTVCEKGQGFKPI